MSKIQRIINIYNNKYRNFKIKYNYINRIYK